MIRQESLRARESVALWIGELANEDALLTYLARPFEDDFGFLLDEHSTPDFACSLAESDLLGRRASTKPFDLIPVEELFRVLPSVGDWIPSAVQTCNGFLVKAARVAVVFRNLRYPPEFVRNPDAPLRFVGNYSWPAGAPEWESDERLRLSLPPFPKLVRSGSRLEGYVQMESWKGFASLAELSADGWEPSRGRQLDGELCLIVESDSAFPSPEQMNTFQHLLEHPQEILDAVLQCIFREYPEWREAYYGNKWSEDGGKTWKSGWELPTLCPPDRMPPLSEPAELRRLIRPGTVYVLQESQGEFARLGFSFSCKWDEEHGLGAMTLGGVVIEVGGAEVAFG